MIMETPSTQSTMFNAIVKLSMEITIPNYASPWQAKPSKHASGSGVVIAPNRILTNAHNIADVTYVTVTKQSEDKDYKATVYAVNHECDLALLDVKDEDFMSDIIPLELSETPAPVQSMVQVVGYPAGGSGLSVTSGIISRIEETSYVHSGKVLLTSQLDAAINSGNSGGPVMQNGKIVGIAFQGLKRRGAEGIGYMVPISIIRHFLKDLENGKVDGFPTIWFKYIGLENSDTRRFLKMSKGQSGVLITHVAKAASKGGLKVNDVLLSIDGHRIANNGNIRICDNTPLKLNYLIHAKQLNESIQVEVLRDGKALSLTLPLVKLDDLCPENTYDLTPGYIIIGGLVFTPINGSVYNSLFSSASLFELADMPDIDIPDNLKRFKNKKNEECIALLSILADDTNRGIKSPAKPQQLVKVNGRKVINLQHLAKLIDECKDDFITFEFAESIPVTLDINKLRAANTRILKRHQIAAERRMPEVKRYGIDG